MNLVRKNLRTSEGRLHLHFFSPKFQNLQASKPSSLIFCVARGRQIAIRTRKKLGISCHFSMMISSEWLKNVHTADQHATLGVTFFYLVLSPKPHMLTLLGRLLYLVPTVFYPNFKPA